MSNCRVLFSRDTFGPFVRRQSQWALPMSITPACDCGRRLSANDRLAGKRGKCPKFGHVFTIPNRVPSAVECFLMEELDAAGQTTRDGNRSNTGGEVSNNGIQGDRRGNGRGNYDGIGRHNLGTLRKEGVKPNGP